MNPVRQFGLPVKRTDFSASENILSVSFSIRLLLVSTFSLRHAVKSSSFNRMLPHRIMSEKFSTSAAIDNFETVIPQKIESFSNLSSVRTNPDFQLLNRPSLWWWTRLCLSSVTSFLLTWDYWSRYVWMQPKSCRCVWWLQLSSHQIRVNSFWHHRNDTRSISV